MLSVIQRSFTERLIHAALFELIAVLICAPALAWFTEKSLAHAGLLTLMFSVIAMLWNMAFNAGFDAAQQRLKFQRGLGMRLVHAVLFELGLIFLLVPLAAWWLSISLLAALVLDIGLILFFLPYTLAFNWGYDLLRVRLLERRTSASGRCPEA
ncbi:multidrug/biocide efflux PACE transporter [Pseudomonas matsuisoli]|uniref:Chlorhexidine efflux transporter domain-containing protein n=1 Tax=Pseudomonas matsuisoli TaxID=1515666 RepID=A0A917Q0M4_9PSED|nr:multidrug/biocide efflux PACE transporter [Pseudomonas matsuisoli]GGK03919.1 hypothetical protein GCM10009304_32330 [Pseudomonas matsuisoli]